MTSDIIDNPVTKHRVKVLESTADLLRMEYTILPGGIASPWHLHLVQQESFQVLAGRLAVATHKKESRRVLLPGENLTVAPGIPHRFENDNPGEAVTFTFDVVPSGKFEVFLRSYAALARDGRIRGSYLPKNLLQAAVLADIADTYLPGFPAVLQKWLLRAAAWFARLLGYRETYP